MMGMYDLPLHNNIEPTCKGQCHSTLVLGLLHLHTLCHKFENIRH